MAHVYPEHPVIGVGAVVIRGTEVLLIRRGRPPSLGRWSLPGGKQKLGETVAEAAAREVMEETGLTIAVGAVAAVVDLIEPDEKGRIRYHYTVVDLLADWVAGEPVAGDDAEAAIWAPLDGLDPFELTPRTLDVIAGAVARR
ncbi:MAG: NUDIX hydrolase [Alphaproteobacteria bacterium]|nr:NUDIX hydrolase [Alphaproteobacteria bacterium]